MPVYGLLHVLDNRECGYEDASDDKDAVAKFGTRLKTALTLEEGDAAPPYMMSRHDKRVADERSPWEKKFNISVWNKDSTTSN